MSADKILGVIGRSLIRHAVVGALTGGLGNAALLAADVMDASDAMDALDAMDAMSPSSSCSSDGPHFGSGGNDGFYPQGHDNWGNLVNQSGNSGSPPYLASDPTKAVDPKSVTWP